jgi:type II secretory pathway pseudopilin PulG
MSALRHCNLWNLQIKLANGLLPIQRFSFYVLKGMKTRQNFTGINRLAERGEGLIQVLVAVAIIAAIAASISSVIIGARDKSVAAQLCNAVREIQDAKARYLEDNPVVSETTAVTFADLQPYLTAMGVAVTAENQLLAGTGRTITNYGTFASGVTIDKHVDLTHISADMQPIVQMISFADGGAPSG